MKISEVPVTIFNKLQMMFQWKNKLSVHSTVKNPVATGTAIRAKSLIPS